MSGVTRLRVMASSLTSYTSTSRPLPALINGEKSRASSSSSISNCPCADNRFLLAQKPDASDRQDCGGLHTTYQWPSCPVEASPWPRCRWDIFIEWLVRPEPGEYLSVNQQSIMWRTIRPASSILHTPLSSIISIINSSGGKYSNQKNYHHKYPETDRPGSPWALLVRTYLNYYK